MDCYVLTIVAALCFSSLPASIVAYSNIGSGTTPNITDILLGRCQDYRLCLFGDPCVPAFRNVDCGDAVEKFMSGIRYVDPCLTQVDAFDSYLQLAPPITSKDKTMFWSGVSGTSIPQDVAQVTPQYTVLEETFPGFMAGNLTWCGSTDQDVASGLNFTVCPVWRSDTCLNNTKKIFWDRASKMLAKQAVGKTFAVLNSQRSGGAFKNDSVFASIEAPNLNPSVVTNVAIFLIPNFTLPIPNTVYAETCKNGTVLYLQKFLTNMGLNHTCEENPTEIMWLQCARFPDSPYCYPFNRGTSLIPLCVNFLLLKAILALALIT